MLSSTNGLVTIASMVEEFEMHPNVFAVSKTQGGILATFLVTVNGSTYVDRAKYLQLMNYIEKIELSAHTLYYPMFEHFGTMDKLAIFMSKVTPHTRSSWNSFFNKSLFRTPECTMYSPSIMKEEFVYIAACLFTVLCKRGKLNYDDWIY